MRLLEVGSLSEVIDSIKLYEKNNSSALSFYKNINSLEVKPLQNNSLQMHLEYLKEVSFILSVIITITIKPRINAKTEDLVVRSDQAGSLSNDDFIKVLQDPSLWKKKNNEMLPEYVHHRQYTDEIRTYENIFIGMLIQLLYKEVINYASFYSKLIPSINENFTINDDEAIANIMEVLADLNKKILRIKDSYFYKEVSKANLKLTKIQPTNILTKNRLYNYCYKFYRKFIRYNDTKAINYDFRLYMYVHILKFFNKEKFNCSSHGDIYHLTFKRKKIIVDVTSDDENNVIFTINNNDEVARHILYLNANDDEFIVDDSYDTNEEISIWNLKYLDTNQEVFINYVKEEEMIYRYIKDKLIEIKSNKKLYTKFCPVCKAQEIVNKNNNYECNKCHSSFVFINNQKEEKIWFKKIRRG